MDIQLIIVFGIVVAAGIYAYRFLKKETVSSHGESGCEGCPLAKNHVKRNAQSDVDLTCCYRKVG
ncbi:hypothetical protein JW960_12530 [candidate division KSB1 bacterium]|nr:hypothetical protein [candidate division KSB1 bacterium]